MDKQPDGQEERDVDQTTAGSVPENSGDDTTASGSTETADSKSSNVNPSAWKHNQEISFVGARSQLQLLAGALQKAIELEKIRLSHLVGARDAYKK